YNQTINVTVDGGNPGPGPGPGTGTIRVGSPGVTFGPGGNSQTPEWIKAGVEGGIPFLNGSPVIQTLSATNTAGIQAAIDAAESAGGGQVVLNNGTYTIDATLNMKSNVRLVGESKDGAILNITMTGSTGSAIVFGTPGQAGTTVYAGMDNLTIQGGHGQPNDFTMTDAKSNFLIHSVYFSGGSKNCWLDNVNIINSGNGAITTWQCSNITIRDCYIERSWNKGAGGHGYVQLSGSYILFFNNTVKKMRHLAIQREGAHHNVVYRNNLEQDVNFHNADAGDNLVEKNVVRLPAGLDSQYHAMMGPWSTQHSAPGPNNVVYGNDCIENNNGGITTFCDPGKVYVPVRFEGDNPFDENTNVPIGGTFYPVNNVPADDGATPSGNCSASNETCEPDSGPGNIFNDDFNCPNWAANYDLTPPEDPSVNGNDVTHMPTGGYNNTPGIRVKISAGSHYGCDFRYRTDVSEAYAQYKVLYEPGFGGQGIGLEGSGGYWGKSPGWDGTRRSCGWGNCVPTTSKPGWSARGSLDRVNGKVKNKAYLYYMDMTPGQDYGDSWYWEGPAMNTNQWYTIDQHIKVNTPGTSNGELRIWQDGTLVFQQTGINFTEVGGDFAKIEGFWFNYYYGGKPVADEDTYVRLDDFRLSTSPIGPSASGSNCIGSQCAVATLSSPSNGANLTFPFNVTGNINVSGYRMSVVMDHKDYPEDDEARPIWVGGTTGTTNSGTFQCTSKPNVKTGATRLIFYGVDDDGNGDGFAYFTEEVVIDVNLSGSSSRTTSENEEAKIIDTEKNVSVYPNPTNRTVNLKLGSDHKYHSLHIVDLSGKTVVTKPVRSTDFRIEIDLDKLSIPKGIYTIRLISPDNIDTQRLIKN
ncbi:MAG: T9SS type A sorting domain-containing protein, partial [Reichenbachiella sp.]|uniref:T9SS type A sorting domain-containing protein n=1 Tax=Reichenbachiella sp. TaxID=2184521 RepID=UPI003297C042